MTTNIKKTTFCIIVLLSSITLYVNSQTIYYDALNFPLIGKITDETETRYERLPAYLKDKVSRSALWTLGKNTSGLAIRFRSNTSSISAKWELLSNIKMNHFTDTGIKGLDLYAWKDQKWQFVNSARPTGKVNEAKIISSMTSTDREYLLFLPLYDGLINLEIGIDSLSKISIPQTEIIKKGNPIVVYGTSITQGGCATRAGMSYTNILTRWMNREFVNLGFSGNGQLDYEIAEIMAKRKDADLFILDFVPNVTEEKIKNKTKEFIKIIRRVNPQTPILLVESIVFPHSYFDNYTANQVANKNKALFREFEDLKTAGDNYIYYLKSENLLNKDGEGTVDGIHLTDLGFQHLAFEVMKKIIPIIK